MAVICKFNGTSAAIPALVNEVVVCELVSQTKVEVITLVPALLGVALARSSNWMLAVPVLVEQLISVSGPGQQLQQTRWHRTCPRFC